MPKTSLTSFILAFFLLFVSSCRQGAGYISSNNHEDSLLAQKTDSIIRTSARNSDLEHSLYVVDSLLELNQISQMRADFGYAGAYMLHGDMDGCAKYLRKVIDDYNRDGGDINLFSMAVVNLVSIYGDVKSQYEVALKIAVPAIAKMEVNPLVRKDDIGCLLVSIGWCQAGLELYDETEKSFNKAYENFEIYKKSEFYNLRDFKESLLAMSTTVLAYIGCDMPEPKQKYTDYCDSELRWYRQQPGHDSLFADETYGIVCLSRTELLAEKNQMEAAAKWYNEFLKTSYAKHFNGMFNSTNYLRLAGRYAEGADIFQIYDQAVREREMDEQDIVTISNFLFPKFHFNYYAGRRDTALAVALKIDSLIAPAIRKQKLSQAAEMATIYETQEKEAQIALQQAQLSEQRLWTAAIVFALITLFFIIYTIYRRRAAKRMAEMKAAQERMESELRIARDIQMSMVPDQFPDYEGLDMYASMTPAKQVGGDLYGYVLLGDQLYFAVGDVSGKGVPASLFMAQATRLFRMLATQKFMPAEICNRMNEALSGADNESGMFVTLFLGLLDLKTGHLDFCNAGHNPPAIGGGDHHGDFLEMVPNAPIGLWPELEYEGEEIDTIKGRALFIYTDGLNEAENPKQEQLGDERLLQVLRDTNLTTAKDVIDALQKAVEIHRDGAEPNDDLTMMYIKIS